MSVSIQLTSASSDVDGDLVEFSPPLDASQPVLLNVIVVPEILSSVHQWSEPGHPNWLLTLFGGLGVGTRVFEFRYRLPQKFRWSALVDLGNVLVNCITKMPTKYRFKEIPFFVISHGLGGMVTKRALSILNDNYYNPSCWGLLDSSSCLVFLGTPHPIYRKGISPEHLDIVLTAALRRVSKEMLSTIREEVAFAWNTSLKFEEIAYDHAVISAYEGRPSKVSFGFFRTRTEVVVDKKFCTTRMRLEYILKANADHNGICVIRPETELYDQIRRRAQQVSEAAAQLLAEPARTGKMKYSGCSMLKATESVLDAADWQSSVASKMDHLKISTDPTSGAIATAGSSNNPQIQDRAMMRENTISSAPAVKLPCYILNQYSKTGGCVGRSDVLKMLDDALLPKKLIDELPGPSELRTFAICGLGGMGKTQIASEFASSRHKYFDAVFFVSADSENKLSEDFNKIAMQLGLSDSTDTENRAVNRDKVLQWLNLPTKQPRGRESEDEPLSAGENATYLLIFDNADSPELLTEFWPVTGTGSILITSRDPHAKSQFYATEGIDLEPLDQDDAAELLQTMTGMIAPEEKVKARQVAERLGGLPLAITQVAGLLQRRKLAFDEFLEFYNEPSFLEEVHRSKERGVHSNYEYMLFNVWAFEDLKLEALRLLEVCSILDPDHIKEIILTSGGDVSLDGFPRTPLALANARTELLKYSLLKRYPEEREVVVHRVLQDAARARMSPDHLVKVFASATNLILAAWPSQHLVFAVEPQHWPTLAVLLPHAEKLRNLHLSASSLTEDSAVAMTFANLMIKSGWFECERGNYEDALIFCDIAEAICLKHPDISPPLLADLDFPYAWVCSFLHKPELKRYHGQRKVNYHLNNNDGTDNGWLNLGIAYTEFSMYFVDVEDFEEAAKKANQALDAYINCSYYRAKTQMPILPRIWAGWAYLGLGKLKEAEDMVLPCVEWVESSDFQWNFNALRTGASLYTLGSIRQAQGQDEAAFTLHERALEHYRVNMGQTHFQTAKAWMKMSEHYIRKREFNKALQYIDSALEAWSNRPIFEGQRARAYFRKSQVLVVLGNELKAKGLLLKAKKTKMTWLKDHEPVRKPQNEDDYESLVPCWVR